MHVTSNGNGCNGDANDNVIKYRFVLVVKWWLYVNHLVLFAYLGVIVRILLTELFLLMLANELPSPLLSPSTQPGGQSPNTIYSVSDVLFPEIFANAAGCLIIGVLYVIVEVLLSIFPPLHLMEQKRQLSSVMTDRSFVKRVYTGLGTGFCGCLTTFSSWQFASVTALSKGSIVSFLLFQVIGLAAAWIMFLLGRYIGVAVVNIASKIIACVRRRMKKSADSVSTTELQQRPTSEVELQHVVSDSGRIVVGRVPGHEELIEDREIVEALAVEYRVAPATIEAEETVERRISHIPFVAKLAIEVFFVLASISLTLTIIMSAVLSPVSLFLAQYSYILCMTPVGCVARYLLCKGNRFIAQKEWIPLSLTVPFFTMFINVTGSLTLTVANIGLIALPESSTLAIFALRGVTTGFAGSFTTVSTFIQEVHTLSSMARKTIYLGLTFLVTDALMVVMIVPIMWLWASTL